MKINNCVCVHAEFENGPTKRFCHGSLPRLGLITGSLCKLVYTLRRTLAMAPPGNSGWTLRQLNKLTSKSRDSGASIRTDICPSAFQLLQVRTPVKKIKTIHVEHSDMPLQSKCPVHGIATFTNSHGKSAVTGFNVCRIWL